LQAGADGTVEDATMLLKGLGRRQFHGPQGSHDGPFARGQNSPGYQALNMMPHLLREQGAKVLIIDVNSLGYISIEDLLSALRSYSLACRSFAVQNGECQATDRCTPSLSYAPARICSAGLWGEIKN
jgi:hypothetical protein